jgi:hypothetical protein
MASPRAFRENEVSSRAVVDPTRAVLARGLIDTEEGRSSLCRRNTN